MKKNKSQTKSKKRVRTPLSDDAPFEPNNQTTDDLFSMNVDEFKENTSDRKPGEYKEQEILGEIYCYQIDNKQFHPYRENRQRIQEEVSKAEKEGRKRFSFTPIPFKNISHCLFYLRKGNHSKYNPKIPIQKQTFYENYVIGDRKLKAKFIFSTTPEGLQEKIKANEIKKTVAALNNGVTIYIYNRDTDSKISVPTIKIAKQVVKDIISEPKFCDEHEILFDICLHKSKHEQTLVMFNEKLILSRFDFDPTQLKFSKLESDLEKNRWETLNLMIFTGAQVRVTAANSFKTEWAIRIRDKIKGTVKKGELI